MEGRRVAVVEGCRTPFCKAGTAFRDMRPSQLGTIAVRELIARAELDPAEVDELIFGTVLPSILEPNVAREVVLGAGLPASVPAYTVGRACASSNQAITSGVDIIARGYGDVVIAGGVEILSDVPMLLSKRLRDALLKASRAKGLPAKLSALASVRPKDLAPIVPAIAEPSTWRPPPAC